MEIFVFSCPESWCVTTLTSTFWTGGRLMSSAAITIKNNNDSNMALNILYEVFRMEN